MFIVRPVVAGAIFLLAQTPGSGATLSAVEAAKQNALVASESDDIQNDNWLLRQRAFTRMTATMTAASGENAVSADAATPASRHAIFTLLDEDVGYAKLAMQSAGAHDVEPIYYGAKVAKSVLSEMRPCGLAVWSWALRCRGSRFHCAFS